MEDRSWEMEGWGMKNEHRKERISSFEDLEAWQMARQLVNAIYALSRIKNLSKDFRLCSQIQSAGISIMSNIAEGFERTHLQEKIQFYNVARGSAGEVRSLLYVISDNFTDATEESERLRDEVTRVGKLVTGLLELDRQTPRHGTTCDPRCTQPNLLSANFHLLSPTAMNIAIVGLGYVGLPLAMQFERARMFQ